MATISTVARPAYVYDEVADTWFPVGAQAIAFVQTFEYTATAAQETFTGEDDNGNTLAYTPVAVRVYLNGALLSPSTDYIASNGTSVVLSTGASVGDILVIVASDTFEVADTYTQAQADSLFIEDPSTKSNGQILSYNGTSWVASNAVAGATGGGTDQVFYNNDQEVTTSYTIPTSKNSMSAGPISIDTGATVTVPSGSVWTVV
jgi:hypothetical protein